MFVTPLIRKSANFAYAGIRMPFALVENRLPENSRVRTGLQTALRTIDSSVGQLLREPGEGSGTQPSSGAHAATEDMLSKDTLAEREAIAEAVRERQANVGELADPDLDVAEVQAQLQAKHAVEARLEAEQPPDSGAGR